MDVILESKRGNGNKLNKWRQKCVFEPALSTEYSMKLNAYIELVHEYGSAVYGLLHTVPKGTKSLLKYVVLPLQKF